MKLLLLADEEEKSLWDYYKPGALRGYDLIISCGDLSRRYLEFITTMASCPVLYVCGNHDKGFNRNPPEGLICLEDRIYDFKGLRILGLGGSMCYIPDSENQYYEEEMMERVKKVNREIVLRNGFDLLVTHAPAKGYGDLEDLPHHGFACFNDLMEKWHPKYMAYGHVHQSYTGGRFSRILEHPSGTKLINAYGKYELTIREEEYPQVGKTGSFLYDLVMSMRDKRKKY